MNTLPAIFVRTHELIESYVPNNSKDLKRQAIARHQLDKAIATYLETGCIDCGIYGKVAESLGRDSRSTLYGTRSQGKIDLYVIVDGKRKPCEYKTNGGRIGNLLAMNAKQQATTYIVYELDYTAPQGKPRKDGTCKPAEHRQAKKIATVAKFLTILEETKATKVIGHSNKSDAETAIQCDSKKLYKALDSLLDYDREWEYFKEDFE